MRLHAPGETRRRPWPSRATCARWCGCRRDRGSAAVRGVSDLLAGLDACEQAERVRRGELTPAELVEAAIARIERLDPQLSARGDAAASTRRARRRVGALPDGPLRGVPFLMKDLGATQAGPALLRRATARCATLGYRAPHDTYLGARFRARRALIALGKTNTPEFGLQSTTQPLAFGPTRNPWDPERSAGRLVGRLARAAVAAGLVPIAHANDGAGSIRIPAAWCGVVGLKPSRGRVPVDPTWIGRSFVGFAMTRSVRDAARAARRGARPRARRSLPRAAAARGPTRTSSAPTRAAAHRPADARAGRAGASRSAAPPRRTPARCSSRSGTASSRTARRRSSRRSARCAPGSSARSSTACACAGSRSCSAARCAPDDVEPFLWTRRGPGGPARSPPRTSSRPRSGSRAGRRAWRRGGRAASTCCSRRPCASRRRALAELRARRSPVESARAPRPAHGLHRALQRDRPAGALAAARTGPRTGCRSACSSSPRRARGPAASAWRRSSRRARPWRGRRPRASRLSRARRAKARAQARGPRPRR